MQPPLSTEDRPADYSLEGLKEMQFAVIVVTYAQAHELLDLFPATWRALAYVVSDANRMGWDPTQGRARQTQSASASVHDQFRRAVGGGPRGLLAERYSKEDLGLTRLDLLPDPEEELEYYHYLSTDSGLTWRIVELFGISNRCWHGCGYLGWPGFPMCRFFFLRNRMIENMQVSISRGDERFVYDPTAL